MSSEWILREAETRQLVGRTQPQGHTPGALLWAGQCRPGGGGGRGEEVPAELNTVVTLQSICTRAAKGQKVKQRCS
ncbi:unnamed protein product [Pleuronectes platessa]|uniref:Uncharacterized protein n=1 Tax=Pleuronectes platessa TaxID=8262 RepID=A0A9N7V1B8_PLEPL|nr:unnamed protein product [Pleuronectes platessa]